MKLKPRVDISNIAGIYGILESKCKFMGIYFVGHNTGYRVVCAQYRPNHAGLNKDKIEGKITVWDRNQRKEIRIPTKGIWQINANKVSYQIRH